MAKNPNASNSPAPSGDDKPHGDKPPMPGPLTPGIPVPTSRRPGDLLPAATGDVTSSREGGRTSIEDPVYFEIAYREARSVPGVVDVKGTFFEMLTGHSKGIHVKTSDTAVLLELRLALEYGRFIPDVVIEVRKRISTAIKRMTDREVRSIKVTIDRLVEGYDGYGDNPRLDHDEDTEHIDF